MDYTTYSKSHASHNYAMHALQSSPSAEHAEETCSDAAETPTTILPPGPVKKKELAGHLLWFATFDP